MPAKKLILTAILYLTPVLCSAQVAYTWVGSVSNEWREEENWSPTGIPGALDAVNINFGTILVDGGNGQVSVTAYAQNGAQVTAKSIDIKEAFSLIDGTITADLRFQSLITATFAGDYDVFGALLNRGDTSLNEADGTIWSGIINSSNFEINGGTPTFQNQEAPWSGFVNQSNARFTSTEVELYSTLQNQGEGALELVGSQVIADTISFDDSLNNPSISNNGVITGKGENQISVGDIGFENLGELEIVSGNTTVSGHFMNRGSVVVRDGASFRFTEGLWEGVGTSYSYTALGVGSYIMDGGRFDTSRAPPHFVLNGGEIFSSLGGFGTLGTFIATGGTINHCSNGGLMHFASEDSVFLTGALSNSGTLFLSSGSIVNPGTEQVLILNDSNGTIRVTGSSTIDLGWLNASGVVNDGQFIVDNAGTVSIASGGIGNSNNGIIQIINSTLIIGSDNNIGFDNNRDATVILENGTLEMSSRISNSPGTITGNGHLRGNDFMNTGTIAPGSPIGRITVDSDMFNNDNGGEHPGLMEFEIGGTEAGIGYDQLVITGNAEISGTIAIKRNFSYTPQLGDSFEIITYSSSGTFDPVFTGLDLGNNLILEPSVTSTALILRVVQGDGTGNMLPQLTLISPEDGNSFPASGPVLFEAEAVDVDGTINVVLFLANETVLNADFEAPYSFLWEQVPTGAYTVFATAMDNLEAWIRTPDVSIQVGDGEPVTSEGDLKITITEVLENNDVEMAIRALFGETVIVEESPNLSSWSTLSTFQIISFSHTLVHEDRDPLERSFYRASYQE